MSTVDIQELKEHMTDVLRRVEEDGETIEVSDQGRIIARIVPPGEASDVRADRLEATERALAGLKQLGEELSKSWPDGFSAVDAVRDVRRDL